MSFFEQLADEYSSQANKSILGKEKKSFLNSSGGLYGTKNDKGLSNKERTKGATQISDGVFKTKDGAVFFKLTDKTKGFLSKVLSPGTGSDLSGGIAKNSMQLMEASAREVKDHIETTDSEWFFPWQFKQFNEYLDTTFGGIENALEREMKISREELNVKSAKDDKQYALDTMEKTESREKGLLESTIPRSVDKFSNMQKLDAKGDWHSDETEEKYKKFRQKRFADSYGKAYDKEVSSQNKLDSLKGTR